MRCIFIVDTPPSTWTCIRKPTQDAAHRERRLPARGPAIHRQQSGQGGRLLPTRGIPVERPPRDPGHVLPDALLATDEVMPLFSTDRTRARKRYAAFVTGEDP